MNLLTTSAIRAYHRCPRYYRNRYVMEIARISDKAEALYFGSIVHEALARYHTGQPMSVAMANAGILHMEDPTLKIKAKVILQFYDKAYNSLPQSIPWEDFEAERPFELPLVNPSTGRHSRSFRLAGKMDGVLHGNPTALVEHKTASTAGYDYVAKLSSDRQLGLYAHALETEGHTCNVAVYNVLIKCGLRRKDKGTEPDDSFRQRCEEWYAKESRFLRVTVALSADHKRNAVQDAWDTGQAILWCHRQGRWPHYRDNCHQWSRPCQYLPLCDSDDSAIITANEYEHKPAHSELIEDEAPVF